MFQNAFYFFLFLFFLYPPSIFSRVQINADILDLSHDSETACFGTVKEIRSTEFSGRAVTQLVFECENPAKGKEGVYTYNFLNLSSLQGSIKLFSSSFIPDQTFQMGKKYFLFLYPPHPKSHLTSPVGGEQGVFKYDSKQGLINSFQNQNLVPKSTSSGSRQFLTRLNEIQSQKRVGLSVEEMIALVREAEKFD